MRYKQKQSTKRKMISMLTIIIGFSMTLCFALSFGMLVKANPAVSYIYYDTNDTGITDTHNGSCTDYNIVNDQTNWGTAGQTKWYVVNSSVTISDRITVNGDVNLILVDGYTLTASKGIGVNDGNSLTIYGQSTDASTMGVLKSQNVDSNCAAIGGNSSQSSGQITVNGGKITTKGGNSAAGIGGGRAGNGSVTINGGIVTVNANSGSEGSAGIGGGYRGSGTITINGGNVTANGREGGAGIGGGGYGGATVTINDGSVVVHGGGYGPGIGSGSGSQIDRSYTATVTINGGTVDAYTGSGSGYKGAAIGCGAHTRGTVTITGGNVTATTYNSGACIGGLPNDTGTNTLVTITGGNITAKAASNNLTSYAGIGGSNCTVILGWTDENDSITSPQWGGNGNSTVSFAEGKSFQYEDTHSLADVASLREGATLIPFIPAEQKNVDQADVSGVRTWYPYTGSAIEPEPVVTYAGTLLAKGTDYSLSYISDHTSTGEKTVTISGKGNYTGTKSISYEIVAASTTYLDDTGVQRTCMTFQCLDQSDTSLSTGWYLVYDNLTINDRIDLTGNVNLILKDNKTLTSMKGISVPSTASLTIYAQSNAESTAGKLVISNPDMYFSGIGSDYNFSDRYVHGNITIVGGAINARGGFSGAAIGSALSSLGGNITIKGGFITANGLVGGAGIGSGANTNGGTITISGGTVTATSVGGAAIGSGGFGDGKGTFGTINITGGTVSAKSESGGAGIGGGPNSAGGTINITNGTVVASASGDTGGAAIGGGKNAAGGDITIQNATIKATANAGAGIGSGGGETTGTTSIHIGTGAVITNALSSEGAGIGSGKNSSATCSVEINNGANVTAKSTIGAGIGGGAGASSFSVEIDDAGTVVNAWAGGIGIQDGDGNLSSYGGAAIGGGADVNGGRVHILDGTVTAKAIGGGAGIGSGTNTKTDETETNGGTIIISDGTVTAIATHRAAGIGGGRRSNGGSISISGGMVIANGSQAAGIGHGGEDMIWQGQGNFYVPIVNDPSEDVGGAWYDSIAPREGTNKTTSDGEVLFAYTSSDEMSITASSYPSTVTLQDPFMYLDTLEEISQQPISDGKTIVPTITETWTISFDRNGGSGDMVDAHVIKNASYELPACGFSAQNGKVFKEWSVKIGNAEAVTYMPGSMITVTADTTVKAIWDTVPIFRSHALLLSGEIGVKFRVAFPAGFNPEGCYMEFEAADGRTDTVQYADAETITGSDDRYFNFNINALELAEGITATLHYGTDETVVNNYSAMTYIQYVQQNVTNNRSLINLVNALQSYGYYMQQSGWTDDKATHTEIPAPATLLTDSDITAARTNVSGMNFMKSLDGSGIENARFSLTLNAKTVINFLVKPGEGVNVTTAGYKTKTINGETYYQYTTEKIGPRNLGRSYSVTIETNNGTATVSAPAMAYVKLALNDSNLDTNKKKAMTAYYKYYYAAANYSE